MNRVVHFEIHADDPDRAQKFYESVFGWKFQHMGEEYGNYRVIATGPGPDEIAGKPLKMEEVGISGGMMKRNAQKPPEGNSPMSFVNVIGVPDIDATIAKLKAAGAVEHMPKTDIPNVGIVAYYADTEGNLFGVLEPVMPAAQT
jgi:predicted enzyme related to lactoylglutathione lyase